MNLEKPFSRNKPINLSETKFEFTSAVIDTLPMTMVFKRGPIFVKDFGTIFIGEISLRNKLMSLPQVGAPTFEAPTNWRMAHVLFHLGGFESVNKAAKNGWDMEIPTGCSSHVIRLNKVKGEIWIHKEMQ